MTLENNVLTIKAGSILTLTGETYATVTTNSDLTLTISSSLSNGLYEIFCLLNGIHNPRSLSEIASGDGTHFPTDNLNDYNVYYNTDDKKIYRYTYVTQSWGEFTNYYPQCIIEMKDGVATFAKDSNGNDMIFNGAGFIGHHAFVYPGIKRLRANGFNTDGTLSSVSNTTTSLQIIEMSSNKNCILLNGIAGYYQEIDNLSQATNSSWWLWYVKNLNLVGVYNNNAFNDRTYTPLVSITLDSNNQVTNWTPRIPVRLATTEMLDTLSNDVVKLTGNQTIAGTKIFSNIPIVLKDGDMRVKYQASVYTKGTAPSSNCFGGSRITDKNNVEIGSVYTGMFTDGRVSSYLTVSSTVAGDTNQAVLGISCDSSGSFYTQAPTPATSDNSTKIATTAFIHNKFQTAESVPATFTDGVWLAVFEGGQQ